MSSVAERFHVKQTNEFIKENKSVVVLHRRRREATAAGGKIWVDDGDVLPQEMRVVQTGNLSDTTSRTTADGRVVKINARGVFKPGADVEVGDLFDLDDEHWEVVTVTRVPRWRVLTELTLNG